MKYFKRFAALAAAAALFCFEAPALTGSWRGELALGNTKLPLVFNFSENGKGETACTMDSPAQGATGIPTAVALCTADSVSVQCSLIGAEFSGRIAGGEIDGTFTQRGFSFPLVLKLDAPLEDRRPQTPKPPYPYTVKDTAFMAPDGVILSATLTLPAAAKDRKVPGVVLVTGSGPQNRDEELFEHKPFAVIADYLARNGVASLRYDDRGTGMSEGNFLAGTTYTFKDDARSGVDFLRSIPEVGKAGVIGHSEGGTIAFMLGAEGVPDFIVSLAGMAVSGKETLMAQNAASLDKSGISGKDKDSCLALVGRMFDEMIRQNKDGSQQPLDPEALAKSMGITVPQPVMESLKGTQGARTPWLDTFIGLDPAESLAAVKCPLLAVNGDKDTQVDASANLAAVGRLCPNAEIRKMPSLNHLMQHAGTGDVAEYGSIRETFSPEVLQIMLEFIMRQ